MTIPLNTGDVVKATIVTRMGAQVALNALHFAAVVGSPPITDTDVANALSTLIWPLITPMMGSSSEYRGILVQKVAPALTSVATQSTIGQGPGSEAGPPMPGQVCGLTSWYTALPYPRNRGRTYWAFPSKDFDNIGGTVLPAYTTLQLALNSSLIGAISCAAGGRVGSVTLGIFHRSTLTFTVITGSIARTAWATQKRRSAYNRNFISPI